MPEWFVALLGLMSVLAGATASIVGFGIGSLLTPLVAARFGTDLAVAAVALPHLSGGLLRDGDCAILSIGESSSGSAS